jgi:carboxyl-terminal processing protease
MVDISSPSDRTGAIKNNADDDASHARSETQGTMFDRSKVALVDKSILPDVALTIADSASAETSKAAKEQVPAPKPGNEKTPVDPSKPVVGRDGKPASQSCPGNDDYLAIMDVTARLIFEPEKLGDLKKVMEPGCVKSTAEAVKLADEAMKVVDDPYTDVLPAKEAADFRTSTEGHLSGVGVQIGRPETAPGKAPEANGPVDVQIVFRNSPADAIGLKKGDQITKVNGKDVSKLSTDDVAAKLLRGPEGTNAKLSILRDGKPMTFDIKRADYSFPSVSDKKIGDIAYVKLEDLGQNDSADEFQAALERHQDAKAFVLDLRDNPGGQVPQALLAASLIMEKGDIMSVKSRVDSDPMHPEYAVEKYSLTANGIKVSDESGQQIGDAEESRMPDLVKKPLVVLTNSGTGSAAEILAGALKDNKEGVLIGEKTFGKGVGQQVLDNMPGGSILKVTKFRFFSPNGQWIGDGHNNRIGIIPDMQVANPKGAEYGSSQDAQLNAALKVLASKLHSNQK